MLPRGSHISGRSLLALLILVILSAKVLQTLSNRKKMTIISSQGRNLFMLLVNVGFYPDTALMITAQAAHETGNFTSSIFKINNNPFGMKLPEVRQTTAIGERNGHAYYKSIEDAVRDYKLYYSFQKYPVTWPDTDTFVQALKDKYYFEAKTEDYKKAVKQFYIMYSGA